MKEKSNALLVFGIVNAVSLIPAFTIAAVLGLLLATNNVAIEVHIVLSTLIAFLSPLSCILGIVLGICLREKGYAKACIILSIVGILLFACVAAFIWYSGFGLVFKYLF